MITYFASCKSAVRDNYNDCECLTTKGKSRAKEKIVTTSRDACPQRRKPTKEKRDEEVNVTSVRFHNGKIQSSNRLER